MERSIPKKMLAALGAVLLACAMGALALAPQSAHAAQAVQEAHRSLTTAAVIDYGDWGNIEEGTLSTDGIFFGIGSSEAGEVATAMTLHRLPYSPEFSDKTITVRYYYGSNSEAAKTKTFKFYDDKGSVIKLKNLEGGKTIKIQYRLNGKLDGKTHHSAWTPLRSVKVKGSSSAKSIYLRSTAGSTKYSYNKYGLVTKIAGNSETWTFKYDGTKIASATRKTGSGSYASTSKLTLKYDSKGRVKKITSTGSSSYDNYTKTFTRNSKGQVKKMVQKNTSTGVKDTTTYYYNSKGLVKKSVSPTGVAKTSYDSKGNPTEASVTPPSGSYGISRYITYKNTYKSGRLVKVVTSMNGTAGPATTKIKYASKKVPKKYVTAVKAQQKALRVVTPGSILPVSL